MLCHTVQDIAVRRNDHVPRAVVGSWALRIGEEREVACGAIDGVHTDGVCSSVVLFVLYEKKNAKRGNEVTKERTGLG